MNIKSIAPPIPSIDPKQKTEGKARAVAAQDRDANGRQEQSEPETKRHLSQEDFDAAIKILSQNPGLKSNHLTIRVEQKDDCRVVLVVDPSGKIVRRLSEQQLWLTTRDKDAVTGKFLDKAM